MPENQLKCLKVSAGLANWVYFWICGLPKAKAAWSCMFNPEKHYYL